jgi:hypothetical protein
MHVTRAYRTNECSLISFPQGKRHENATASAIFSNRFEPSLRGRVRWVVEDEERTREHLLDRDYRNAVGLTFGPVPIVPVEADQPSITEDNFRSVHTIVNPLHRLAA